MLEKNLITLQAHYYLTKELNYLVFLLLSFALTCDVQVTVWYLFLNDHDAVRARYIILVGMRSPGSVFFL